MQSQISAAGGFGERITTYYSSCRWIALSGSRK